MRDAARHGGKYGAKAADAEDDRDFEEIVSVGEIVSFEVRGKMKEIQCFCEDGGKAMPTLVLEVSDLFREVVDAEHDNTVGLDRTNNLILELNKSSTSERLACDRVQKTEPRVKTLEEHVKASDSKYSKDAEDAAQAENIFRMRLTSLDLQLKPEEGPKRVLRRIVLSGTTRIEMLLLSGRRRLMP